MTVIASCFCLVLLISVISRIEYADNTQYNNLETILVQNNVNDVYTFGNPEKGKLMYISKLLEQLEISLKLVKKRYSVLRAFYCFSEFSQETIEQDLSALIGEDNLNLHPTILKMPSALKAANVLVTVFPFYYFQFTLTSRISISVMARSSVTTAWNPTLSATTCDSTAPLSPPSTFSPSTKPTTPPPGFLAASPSLAAFSAFSTTLSPPAWANGFSAAGSANRSSPSIASTRA